VGFSGDKMIKWVVQNNMRTDGGDSNIIKDACKKFGFLFEGVKVIPFSSDIPNISGNDMPIYYGSTGWVDRIYNEYPSAPGVFFNPESVFTYWTDKYGAKSLNFGAKETTFKKIVSEQHSDDERFFIRPISDQKEFSGSIMSFGDIKEWSNRIQSDVPDLENLPIIIAEPCGIAKEWRLFMINGKVCTGSRYRTYFVRNTDPYVPDNVIEFAEEQAKIYSPVPIFVMDIAESAKNLFIIEIGCFNSAGFYDSDIEKIVHDVSHYVLENK
jgi:hypothetical protein